MRPFKRILLALDLSPESSDVWRETCALAKLFGAELHLVHVVPGVSPSSAAFARSCRGVERQLEELRRGCEAGEASVSPHSFIRAGEPATHILALARDLDVDLVAVGASPRTAIDRLLLRSTADRIVRESIAPVWVVRPGVAHERFERALVAVDPVRPDREAIHAAGLVVRGGRSHVTILAITSAPEDLAADQAVVEGVRSAVEGTATQSLEVEVQVRHAPRPAPAIVEAATQGGADLLVLGESRRSGLSRWFQRDTAEQVLRRVPCSILRLPPARRYARAAVE